MCGPQFAMAGLNAIGSIASINAQNSAAVKNAAHAKQAMNDEIATTTEKYIEQNRSLIQGGFDAVLAGRADAAEAYTSAIQNGVQGASVKAVLRSNRQAAGRSAGRTKQELDSLKTQTGASYKHIRSKAQGRINSVPTTSFGLGDAASILSPIVKAEMG